MGKRGVHTRCSYTSTTHGTAADQTVCFSGHPTAIQIHLKGGGVLDYRRPSDSLKIQVISHLHFLWPNPMSGGNEGARATLWEVGMGGLVRFMNPMVGGNGGGGDS